MSGHVIPMSSPDLTAADVEAVTSVLQTRHLSLGPQLEAFEKAFASYVGTAHAVGVNSGTSGLHLAIIAAGVGEGDLVITTPFSFISSANCILFERAVPIFVDVDPQTLNIDPSQVVQAANDLAQGGAAANRWLPPAVRKSQTPNPKSQLKAVLPVDAFGQPADLDPIFDVARRHDLAIIQDAC
ncbi:MAG: DegT/DnrJ/EryC1/StrS family aminotransferase, partial [Chloroflexota bacterium]|nr:DegT/DnrJ/EryC1/StrS family aminotransferase [Chloroflexota bacterium]